MNRTRADIWQNRAYATAQMADLHSKLSAATAALDKPSKLRKGDKGQLEDEPSQLNKAVEDRYVYQSHISPSWGSGSSTVNFWSGTRQSRLFYQRRACNAAKSADRRAVIE